MYTKGGDKGETGLYGAKRVAKDSMRIEAYGTVDELNSFVGLAISASERVEISSVLKEVQNRLFVAGADLASELAEGRENDRVPRIRRADTEWLEKRVDELQLTLPRLASFVLPGGSALSANLHLARAVCRRAERRVIALSKAEKINPEMIPFLNRLSTYLFNLARYANMLDGIEDEPWRP